MKSSIQSSAVITHFNFTILHTAIMVAEHRSDFNTLRPRQNGRPFPHEIFKWIFLNENVWISIKISLNFVPRGPIYNIPALVQIMACRRPGDKPLSELMLVSLLTHICVTRPQWIKLTRDTPYLTLMGKLWDVYCKDILEIWLRYNGTALHPRISLHTNTSSVARWLFIWVDWLSVSYGIRGLYFLEICIEPCYDRTSI